MFKANKECPICKTENKVPLKHFILTYLPYCCIECNSKLRLKNPIFHYFIVAIIAALGTFVLKGYTNPPLLIYSILGGYIIAVSWILFWQAKLEVKK